MGCKENQHNKINLQKGLGIKISVDRNTKSNTSIIKIEKNNSGNSGNSGEHKISPENESLSSENNQDLSINLYNSGDTGHTGDKSGYLIEGKNKGFKLNRNINNTCINCPKPSDSRDSSQSPVLSLYRSSAKVNNYSIT